MKAPLTTQQKAALRDQIAMHAMQGLLAANWCASVSNSDRDVGFRMVSDDAYAMAEAMLKARTTWQEKA